ncbi:hypothetical protein [Dubosiella newyorkensis]|uniref:hypothetical protein n=1 Tax=Dubosiella newyorkensis TaxID=1862672 RepID=UPI003F66835E
MEEYDFDKVVERKGTGARNTMRLIRKTTRSSLCGWRIWILKCFLKFGGDIERANHPIYGYRFDGSLFKGGSVLDEKAHDFLIEKEWIVCTGGGPALKLAVQAYSKPNDAC